MTERIAPENRRVWLFNATLDAAEAFVRAQQESSWLQLDGISLAVFGWTIPHSLYNRLNLDLLPESVRPIVVRLYEDIEDWAEVLRWLRQRLGGDEWRIG